MMKYPILIVLLFLVVITALAQENKGYVSSVWVADQGDGTYKNPILFADYSDPDVCKVGDDFYMTASSFNSIPGLPILHSRDLVNWTIINHSISIFPDRDFNIPQHGNGVWAPSIRHHDGWFYIYWGDPDRGIYMVKTREPAGKWSAPVLVKKAYGNIDACPLWDEDGKVYMVHAFANSRAGVSDVLQVQELTPEGDNVTRNRKIVYNGYQKHPTLEGPKFYKRNGYYYIFAPGGGVAQGWQVVLRSKDPFGPYEDKIVLAQGNTDINGPHQGGYVELDNGEGWFIHFQEVQPYGRIVHLQPVNWVDDWPVMGKDQDGDGTGEPVRIHKKPNTKADWTIVTPRETDEFSANKLGLQWQWQANFQDHWYSLEENPGFLRLYPHFTEGTENSIFMVPNLLLQKLPAPEFTATTKVNFAQLKADERVGFLMMGMDYANVYVEKSGQNYQVAFSVCKDAFGGKPEIVQQSAVIEKDEIWFRMEVGNGGICQFYFSIDGKKFNSIGEKFKAVEGRWIGAKMGLYCQKKKQTGDVGHADIDYFKVESIRLD